MSVPSGQKRRKNNPVFWVPN